MSELSKDLTLITELRKLTTNTEFVKLIKSAAHEKWGYVWGENGELWTKEKAERNVKRGQSVPYETISNYWLKECKRWEGKISADCSGLIVYALRKLGIFKPTQDMGSSSIRSMLINRGKFKDLPDISGLIVWRTGHVGVYIGDGVIVEAKGTRIGVVFSELANAKFTEYGYIPGLEYIIQVEATPTIYFGRCTGNEVNIRNDPAGKIIYKVNKGQMMLIAELHDQAQWSKVSTYTPDGEEVTGWMFKDYIQHMKT